MKNIFFTMMDLQNKVLVSLQPGGEQEMLLIFKHTESGTWGFNLNCVLPDDFCKELLESFMIDVSETKLRIHYGGMYDMSQGLLLHTTDDYMHNSHFLTEELALTSSLDLLRKVAKNEGPENVLMLVGHTRFPPKQIEEEVFAHKWLIVPLTPKAVFARFSSWSIQSEDMMSKGLHPFQLQMSHVIGRA